MSAPPEPLPSRRRRRGLAIAALILAFFAIVSLAAWLSISRSSLWLPLLNRQLPAGLEVVSVTGFRPGWSGVAWQRIELLWNGQHLTLGQGRADWALHKIRPLDAQLLHIEAEHLLVVLAPADNAPRADWEPLPRVWETSWWHLVADLSGRLRGFDVLNHAGETLLSGRLHWQPGAQAGEASVFLVDTEITVRWAEERRVDSEPGWAAVWHSHGSPFGPLHAEGEAQLYWRGEQLAFRVYGQLGGEPIALISSDGLTVNAAGHMALFDATDEVARGRWSLHGQYEGLEALPVAWNCHGEAALPATLTPAPQLNRCEGISSAGTATLEGPVTLDWQPLAIRWEQPLELAVSGAHGSGTLYVDASACVLDNACDWPLQLTFEQGHWGGFSWGQGNILAHLHRSAANALRLTDLDVHLIRLQHAEWAMNDLSIFAPAITVWQPDIDSWQISQLTTSAHIERQATGLTGVEEKSVKAESAALAFAVRGSLIGGHFTTPSQWSAQLDVALEPTWQGHPLPAYHLKQHLHQTEAGLEASGTVSTQALEPLLQHRVTLSRRGTAQFTARLNSSVWPDETDMITALLGNHADRLPLRLPIRGLHGNVSADLSGRWGDDQLQLDVTGRADELAGLLNQYAFAGVTLAPFQLHWSGHGLSTRDPVRWQVREFNAGVVLTDLSGQLALTQSRWHLTEVVGQLLGGQFQLDTLSATEGGNLRFNELDLAAAVALMNQPDIQVSGAVYGHLPVALEDGMPVIRNGILRNDGPGIISYRPAPGSDFLRNNPQTAIVSDTLHNFHYQRLEADVTYRANGDLLLATRLEGRNPDLEGSPPVHLNLNVEQNVPSLMRSLRAGDDINAWLERRVR